jgi:hypothetical protein
MEQDLLDVLVKPVSIVTVPIRVGEGRDVTQTISKRLDREATPSVQASTRPAGTPATFGAPAVKAGEVDRTRPAWLIVHRQDAHPASRCRQAY